MILNAYEACRATGGRSLTLAESRDRLHLFVLSQIDAIVRSAESSSSVSHAVTQMALLQFGGRRKKGSQRGR